MPESQEAIEAHNAAELWKDAAALFERAEATFDAALSALEDLGVKPPMEPKPTLAVLGRGKRWAEARRDKAVATFEAVSEMELNRGLAKASAELAASDPRYRDEAYRND